MACTYSSKLPLLLFRHPLRLAGGGFDQEGWLIRAKDNVVGLHELNEAGSGCRHACRKCRDLRQFHVGSEFSGSVDTEFNGAQLECLRALIRALELVG